MTLPLLTFCPYLPLKGEMSVGPWRICPLSEFNGPWFSKKFEQLSHTLINAHSVDGNPVVNPALIYHSKHGAHGRAPRRDVLARIQAVLNVAALSNSSLDYGHMSQLESVTTDNAATVVWPIDVQTSGVAKTSGAIIRSLIGGFKIDNSLTIQAPDHIQLPTLDLGLDDAELYDALWRYFAQKTAASERTLLAVRWLAKAWVNSSAVELGDRIMFLKTGFEAILDNSSSGKGGMEALESLFEDAYKNHKSYEIEGLKWVRGERRVLWRDPGWNANRASVRMRLLQIWFNDFGNTRNRLIHDGEISSFQHTRFKAYRGPHFHTASRVLLEAIRTVVGVHSGRLLALPPFERDRKKFAQEFAALMKQARKNKRPTKT